MKFDLQEPKPSASSKMMMSWLSSSGSLKRKESCMRDSKEEPDSKAETPRKSGGALQLWLQGSSKKPRTK